MRSAWMDKRVLYVALGVAVICLAAGLLIGRSLTGGPAVPQSPHADEHSADEQAEELEMPPDQVVLSDAAITSGGIKTVEAARSQIGRSLTVPGVVEISPNRVAKITPPAAGKVSRLLVDRGETVRSGQVVAVIESSDVAQARAGVRDAQSSVDKARSRLNSAEQALQRQKELAAAGAFSQAPLQAAQSDVNEAQSELLQAQTELQTHTTALQRAERLYGEELISRAEMEEVQLEHRQDEARVERAEQRLALARQTLEREKKLFNQDLLAKQVVQTAEADVRAARAEVDSELSRLSSARSNLAALVGAASISGGGTLPIRSPIAGTVVERLATLGEAVERTTPMFTIENRQSILVVAQVPEKDVGAIREGQSIQVETSAYPNERFPGVVQSLAGRVDEKTRTLPVRCLVENSGGLLRPEMFARVTILTGSLTSALVVPESAVRQAGAESHVYVRNGNSFTRKAVVTGRTTGSSVEIIQGLEPGDSVVSEGVFVLEGERASETLKGHDH